MMIMMMVIVIKIISKNNVNNHSSHLKGQVSLALQLTVLDAKEHQSSLKTFIFPHLFLYLQC